MTALFPSPQHPRRYVRKAESAHELTERVLRLWDEGLNTADIAGALFETEAVVCVALRLGREARRTSAQ